MEDTFVEALQKLIERYRKTTSLNDMEDVLEQCAADIAYEIHGDVK